MPNHLLGLNKYLMIFNGQWKFNNIKPIYSLLYKINNAWIYLYAIYIHVTFVLSAIVLRNCPISIDLILDYLRCVTAISATFILSYNDITGILNIIREYENEDLAKESPKVIEVYKKHGELVDKITKGAFMVITFAGVLWYIVGSREQFPATENCPGSVKGLVFKFFYPFNIERHLWIGHIADWIVVTSSCTFMSYTKLLPICLLVFVLVHIKILQEYVRNLNNITETGSIEYNQEDARDFMIKQIAKKHEEIIRIKEKVQSVVGFVVLIFYFGESVNLATYLVTLIQTSSLELMGKMMIPFLFIIGELYIFSWLAEEIIQEGLAVSEVIYNEINWLDFNKKQNMMLLMVMRRSQIPLSIQLPFISELSMDTFLKIIKLCYSVQTYMTTIRE